MIFPNTDMPPPLHFQLSDSNPALHRTLSFTASHTSAELQLVCAVPLLLLVLRIESRGTGRLRREVNHWSFCHHAGFEP
jgi:hypothetical protein